MKEQDKIQRQVLPIPDRQHVGLTTYDAKDPDTKYPPIEPLRPPKGAPNVLIVLIDDVGFGASSAFGGPCHTPTAERLAANGLQVQPLSHHRALLADTAGAADRAQPPHGRHGRHHRNGHIGARQQLDPSQDLRAAGRDAQAERLRDRPVRQVPRSAAVGRPARWVRSTPGPPAAAFEYFYGFIGGETNQYYPALYEGTTPVEPDKTPEEGYHFTEDLANKAIKWVRQQKALMPDKPFFMYFAPGATHAPHHVPKEWSDKYKGKFDQGWDKLREETFARQKKLGVIPPDCELTKRHPEIPAWDDIAPKMKPILARQMEIYAGFLEHTDHHVGRLIDALGGPGNPRRHPDLLHHRRQRRLGGRHAPGHVQRDVAPQRVRTSGDPRVPEREHRQVRRTRMLTTTMRWAGRTPWTRRTSGPSRSPRTGAARATARSSTGPKASRPRARCARSSIT